VESRVRKVILVLLVHRVSKDLRETRETLGLLVLQDLRVIPGLREFKVWKVQ